MPLSLFLLFGEYFLFKGIPGGPDIFYRFLELEISQVIDKIDCPAGGFFSYFPGYRFITIGSGEIARINGT